MRCLLTLAILHFTVLSFGLRRSVMAQVTRIYISEVQNAFKFRATVRQCRTVSDSVILQVRTWLHLSWSSCPIHKLSYFPHPPPWLTIPTLLPLLYKQSLPSWAEFYPEDVECTFVRNIFTHLPDYTLVKQNSNEFSPPSAAANLSSPPCYAPRRSVCVYPAIIGKNVTSVQRKKNTAPLLFGYTLRQNSPKNRPWRPRRGVEVQLYSFFKLGAR